MITENNSSHHFDKVYSLSTFTVINPILFPAIISVSESPIKYDCANFISGKSREIQKKLSGEMEEASKVILDKMLVYIEKKYISVPMKMAKEILLEKNSNKS